MFCALLAPDGDICRCDDPFAVNRQRQLEFCLAAVALDHTAVGLNIGQQLFNDVRTDAFLTRFGAHAGKPRLKIPFRVRMRLTRRNQRGGRQGGKRK